MGQCCGTAGKGVVCDPLVFQLSAPIQIHLPTIVPGEAQCLHSSSVCETWRRLQVPSFSVA